MTNLRMTSSPRHGRAALLAVAIATVSVLPRLAGAQGALSAQGFGYPTGGLSARAQGTAGATGEFDLLSMRNPAALNDMGASVLSVQGEPEFRTVRVGNSAERSRLQRIPLIAAGLRVRDVSILLSGATLLDRSFTTESEGSTIVDGMPVPTVDRYESRGAMTELRLAAGWRWKQFGLGAGVVAITGEHDVVRARGFPDTLRFGGVLDSTRIGFEGLGAALGVNWRPVNDLLVGVSVRTSGPLNALRRDSTISSANLPTRIGVGVLYQGIPGLVLAASGEQIAWSAMNGLGSDEGGRAQDAVNWAVGVEFVGGTLRRAPVFWRAGYGRRDLPFLLRTLPITEQAFHAGLGIPLVPEAASLDLAVQRSMRRIQGDQAREDAWGLTAGITIRP